MENLFLEPYFATTTPLSDRNHHLKKLLFSEGYKEEIVSLHCFKEHVR
jgi:hypothetical protein